MRRLNDLYDSSGRAFRVERVAGGYQLLTRAQFAGWVRRLEHVPPETRLSAPALETLAVIAYRQPVLRAEIEAIRGVNCGEILRQLMERDLVRIAGRSDELGRPYLYATTRHFLRMFGLEGLERLPRVQAMQSADNDAGTYREKGCFRPPPTGESKGAQKEEESTMLVTLSDLDRESALQPLAEDPLVVPPSADYDDDNYDDFYNEGEEENEVDVDLEEAADDDLEDEDDEDFVELEEDDEEEEEEFDDEEEEEDEWEEVGDDDEWEEEEDADWDDELDEDEEEDEEDWD